MSYVGISVREAMEKINNLHGGWFLPQVQRQYVWGERYESESYVCLLMDSLLRGFPIGGLVLWETIRSIPYRQFLDDYKPGVFAKLVDEGRWTAHKFLVYDGQQRLQTLHSVLYFSFNGRVLHFDLTFDDTTAEPDDTGFVFRDKCADAEPRYLKLTRLVSMPCDIAQRTALEHELATALAPNDRAAEVRIKTHIGRLWDVFVATGTKSIAYFPVQSSNDALVNEVFRRLNTGGIALTQVEMVLGKTKAKYADFEERLWSVSTEIEKQSGIHFRSADIFQFLHLIVKGTIRIDESRVSAADVDELNRALESDTLPLIEFLRGYLWETFKINHASIVPRWLAVLPMCVYLAGLKRGGHKWKIKDLTSARLALMNQYFILSQCCDWNTQTMVNSFAGFAMAAGLNDGEFPLNEIRDVAVQKNRTGALNYHQFLAVPWLATKILTPSRTYIFHDDKPEVDHIFPLRIRGYNDDYQRTVDVLWNFQPMPAGVNGHKTNRHPREFFTSADGAKYLPDYDFLPDLSSSIWDDYRRFVRFRHLKMRRELLRRYGLRLQRDR